MATARGGASVGRRPTATVKKKAFSRADLLELQASVSKLHRDLDLQSALANDSSQSLEYVGGQVEALRSAYSTLSDVMVDEIEAVRNEARAMRQEFEQRQADSDSVTHRQSRVIKALKVELKALKEHAQRQRAEIQALRAAVADTTLATKMDDLQEQVEGVRQDGRSARSAAEAAATAIREKLAATAAEVDDMRTDLAEAGQLRAALTSVQEDVAENTRQILAAKGGVSSCAAAVGKIQEELKAVGASIATLKQSHHAAATALAQDVALLAEDAAAAKARAKADAAKASDRMKALNERVSRQSVDAASAVQARLASFKQEVTVQNEMFRQAVSMVQKHQSRIKARAEEQARTTSGQIKALTSAVSTLETSVANDLNQLRQFIEDQTEESQKQFDAVSHAVHTFADIIHVDEGRSAAPATPAQ